MGDFGRITNQPKPLPKLNSHVFTPGHWSTPKAGARSTTYIQNNFYGSQQNYHNWGDAWAGYDYGNCDKCQDSGKPGVLGWIGLGAGVLGGVLGGIFGGKKSEQPEEKGAPENPAQPETPTQPERQSVQKPASEQPKVEQPKVDNPPVDDDNASQPTVDNFDWNSSFSTIAMDEEVDGKSPTENISGEVKVTEQGEDGKAPKKFTITDGNNTYTFKKIETASGKVQYECTGVTGGKNNTYTKGNVYDCNLVGGKPVLIQPKDEDGWGMGLDRAQRTNFS